MATHLQAGATIHNGLGKSDEMGGGCRQHHGLHELRHAFARRHSAGQHLQGQQHQQQTELGHGACDGGHEDTQGGYDPNNPTNPANRYIPYNPFNPAIEYNPQNPLNPVNGYNHGTLFRPLNSSR